MLTPVHPVSASLAASESGEEAEDRYDAESEDRAEEEESRSGKEDGSRDGGAARRGLLSVNALNTN